jgi:hypothetical protein
VILFDLVGDDEDHPTYKTLTVENGNRRYSFLKSVVEASLAVGRPFLSSQVLKALNFQTIACLHAYAGEFNGNGRTATAACYFVLCVKAQQWLSGATILPELISRERQRYELGLRHADESMVAGAVDLAPLHALLVDLLKEQIAGAPSATP